MHFIFSTWMLFLSIIQKFYSLLRVFAFSCSSSLVPSTLGISKSQISNVSTSSLRLRVACDVVQCICSGSVKSHFFVSWEDFYTSLASNHLLSGIVFMSRLFKSCYYVSCCSRLPCPCSCPYALYPALHLGLTSRFYRRVLLKEFCSSWTLDRLKHDMTRRDDEDRWDVYLGVYVCVCWREIGEMNLLTSFWLSWTFAVVSVSCCVLLAVLDCSFAFFVHWVAAGWGVLGLLGDLVCEGRHFGCCEVNLGAFLVEEIFFVGLGSEGEGARMFVGYYQL